MCRCMFSVTVKGAKFSSLLSGHLGLEATANMTFKNSINKGVQKQSLSYTVIEHVNKQTIFGDQIDNILAFKIFMPFDLEILYKEGNSVLEDIHNHEKTDVQGFLPKCGLQS